MKKTRPEEEEELELGKKEKGDQFGRLSRARIT